MPLFEPYRPQLQDGERPPVVADLLVRTALPSDVAELAGIEAAREGGEPAEHAAKLEKLLTGSATGKALVLAAQHGPSLVGIAKIRRFTPPPDSPPNVAPAGWYLSGVIVAEDYRRRGVGRRLTQARLNWIAERDRAAYYFSNARNRGTNGSASGTSGFMAWTSPAVKPFGTITFGRLEGEIVVLVHTERRGELHVISLRKAEKYEARYYIAEAKRFHGET